MGYSRDMRVEFNHCDPAGIVFYPRYFEMTNSVIENFFADVVGRSFSRIHLTDGNAVPTVRLATEFRTPSRLGEVIRFTLTVREVGRSSLTLALSADCGGEHRFRSDHVLVWVAGGRAASWPDDMRAALERQMEPERTEP